MTERLSPVSEEKMREGGYGNYEEALRKEFENGELPEVIFILSGGIEFHKYRGFRSPSYSGNS